MKFMILVLAAAVADPAGAQQEFMLAYSSRRDEDVDLEELYLMRPDGSRKTRLTFNEGNEDWPVWSADGRHIYYWSNHHRRTTHTFAGDVFRMTLPDRFIEQITPGGQGGWPEGSADWNQPSLSPAGDRLAVAVHDHDALSPRQLFFVHIASGLATPVLDLRSWNKVIWTDEHPSWSPDGNAWLSPPIETGTGRSMSCTWRPETSGRSPTTTWWTQGPPGPPTAAESPFPPTKRVKGTFSS